MNLSRLKHISLTGGLFIWLVLFSPLKLYREAIFNNIPPQLILVLGGDVKREYVGVRMAHALNLPLIVSGGSNPEHAKWLINKEGIPSTQVKLDYRAKDTFGNFTSLIDELFQEGIRHSLLITSEDHLPRAMAVGNVIAGSRGIRLTSISVPCDPYCKKENLQKQIFDLIRALTWVATGTDPKLVTQQSLKVTIKDGLKTIFRYGLQGPDPVES